MNRNQPPLSLPSGPLEGPTAPRRPASNRGKRFVDNTGAKSKPKRKETRPFVHGPVKVPPELLLLLVKHGRRNALANRIRIAVTNCLHQSPGGKDYPVADLWDVTGRWAASLRGQKQIEGITERHQAWEHIQRLRYAMERATNDPMLQNKLKYRINMFLHEALLAWDNALSAHFNAHPEDLMTPDEYAGMEKAPSPQSVDDIAIFKRPPSKPGPKPKEGGDTENASESNDLPAIVPGRPAQKASLFGPKIEVNDPADTENNT